MFQNWTQEIKHQVLGPVRCLALLRVLRTSQLLLKLVATEGNQHHEGVLSTLLNQLGASVIAVDGYKHSTGLVLWL